MSLRFLIQKGIRRHFTVFFSPWLKTPCGSSNNGNSGHSLNTLLPLWCFMASLWVFPFPFPLSLFYLFELFWIKKYKKFPVQTIRCWQWSIDCWKQHQNDVGKDKVGGTLWAIQTVHCRLPYTPPSEENINPSESSRAIPGRSHWKLPCECVRGFP